MLGLKLWVVVLILAVMIVLRLRKAGMLVWALAWWLALYALFKYGFVTPVPQSVITLYMGIVTASILAYVSSSRERWRSTVDPILTLILDPRRKALLWAVVLLIPALTAFNVYSRMNVPLEAPSFGRSVHPAPPDSILYGEREVDLIREQNPHRHLQEESHDAFAEHVENGRRVYFQNCFFCHGDRAGGDGMFIYGLNPIPSNFTDPGVLPMFQETFFFWRIAKGGPGLPEEGGPWESAMPAWEKFLTEDEVWDSILFMYDYTGFEPRAREEGHE